MIQHSTAIFDKANGFLQFISPSADPMTALKQFDDEVGVDPNGEGLEAIREHYDFYICTPEQVALLEAEDCRNATPRGYKIGF
jgi:hypothetical protein